MKILKLDNLKKQFFSSKLTLKPETDAFQKKVKNNVLKIQNYYKKCKVIGLQNSQSMIFHLNRINLTEDRKEMGAEVGVKGVEDF